MTATAVQPAALPRFEHLEVAKLKPCPNNPRRIDDKHPSLPGLAQSILQQGILEPLLVRDLGGRGFEILAGERRWRAARIAGVEKVPCLVRECNDQAAFEITVTENLQREDLHWLEEARGVELMVSKGWEVETIAKQLGKSPAWVALRAKLATISEKWRKVVEDPRSDYHSWPVSYLEQVARLPRNVQDAMLASDAYWVRSADSLDDLIGGIEEHLLHLLKAAPWDLNDGKLVIRAGACVSCPKRSSCQNHLFEDVKGDTCLDGACWDLKAAAHAKQRIEQLRAKAPKAPLVTDEYYSRDKAVMAREHYDIAKADQKGARPAIMVKEGAEPRLVHIVTGADRKGDRGGSTGATKEGPIPLKERLEQKQRARARVMVGIVRLKLAAGIEKDQLDSRSPLSGTLEDVRNQGIKDISPYGEAKMPPRPTLMALVASIGVCMEWRWDSLEDETWEDFDACLKLSPSELDQRVWNRTRIHLVDDLLGHMAGAEEAERVAQLVGLDFAAIRKDVIAAMPLPRTLAEHFEEDGTPKKAAAKPSKKAKAK